MITLELGEASLLALPKILWQSVLILGGLAEVSYRICMNSHPEVIRYVWCMNSPSSKYLLIKCMCCQIKYESMRSRNEEAGRWKRKRKRGPEWEIHNWTLRWPLALHRIPGGRRRRPSWPGVALFVHRHRSRWSLHDVIATNDCNCSISIFQFKMFKSELALACWLRWHRF